MIPSTLNVKFHTVLYPSDVYIQYFIRIFWALVSKKQKNWREIKIHLYVAYQFDGNWHRNRNQSVEQYQERQESVAETGALVICKRQSFVGIRSDVADVEHIHQSPASRRYQWSELWLELHNRLQPAATRHSTSSSRKSSSIWMLVVKSTLDCCQSRTRFPKKKRKSMFTSPRFKPIQLFKLFPEAGKILRKYILIVDAKFLEILHHSRVNLNKEKYLGGSICVFFFFLGRIDKNLLSEFSCDLFGEIRSLFLHGRNSEAIISSYWMLVTWLWSRRWRWLDPVWRKKYKSHGGVQNNNLQRSGPQRILTNLCVSPAVNDDTDGPFCIFQTGSSL